MTTRHAYLDPSAMKQSDTYDKMYCQVNGVLLTRESGIFENHSSERYTDVTWMLVSKKKDGGYSVRMIRDIGGVGYLYTHHVEHVHFLPRNTPTTYRIRRF
mgnify:FL=1